MATKSRTTQTHRWLVQPGNSEVTQHDTENVTGVFSRRYPVPLTDTLLYGRRQTFNPAKYDGNGRKDAPGYLAASAVKDSTFNPSADSRLRASGRAASKFYSDLDLGETLGSFRETARLIENGATNIKSYYDDVRRFGLRRTLEIREIDVKNVGNTKNASNAYLQFSFGWGQLAQDVYNSLSGSLARSQKGQSVSGSGRSSNNQEETLGSKKAGYRVTLSGTVSNPVTRDLNRLGLANPARTAWQLTRLSFVLDWWLGIAQSLGYYTWNTGLSNTRRSEISQIIRERNYQIGGPSGEWVWGRTQADWTRNVSNIPIAWRGIVLTDGAINLSIGKAITAMALLRQAI